MHDDDMTPRPAPEITLLQRLTARIWVATFFVWLAVVAAVVTAPWTFPVVAAATAVAAATTIAVLALIAGVAGRRAARRGGDR